MSKIYDFDRLIKKYSVPIRISLPADEKYEHGRLVKEPSPEKVMRGAVVPMSEKKIYQSGGHYISSDRQLYTKEPIAKRLDNITVRHNGTVYKVEEDTDYSDYGNIFVYVLRRVDSFDKSERY